MTHVKLRSQDRYTTILQMGALRFRGQCDVSMSINQRGAEKGHLPGLLVLASALPSAPEVQKKG